MEQEDLKLIEKETGNLLNLLQIEATIEVEVDEQGIVYLNLNSESAGLLIGSYGQTLSSLQLILNLLIYKKLGRWVKIILNVGDWRQRREEYLQKLALDLAQRAETSGEPVVCPFLTAAERRIIHLALQDNASVATESSGEGKDRRLIVKPKI